MICQTTPQMLNFGSSIDPVTGRSRWISPLRSFRSATASRTGSFVASGLSTASPKVNWSRKTLFSESSFLFSIWYLRLRVSFPFWIPYPAYRPE